MTTQSWRFVGASTIRMMGFTLALGGAVACTPGAQGRDSRGNRHARPVAGDDARADRKRLPPGHVGGHSRPAGCAAPRFWRLERVGPGSSRAGHGCSGRGRCLSPTRRRRSIASSACGSIRGQLYEGPSWLDGRPSLVLDYSQTSRIYADNRDEIRQVAPGSSSVSCTIARRRRPSSRCTSPWKPSSEHGLELTGSLADASG